MESISEVQTDASESDAVDQTTPAAEEAATPTETAASEASTDEAAPDAGALAAEAEHLRAAIVVGVSNLVERCHEDARVRTEVHRMLARHAPASGA